MKELFLVLYIGVGTASSPIVGAVGPLVNNTVACKVRAVALTKEVRALTGLEVRPKFKQFGAECEWHEKRPKLQRRVD